MYIGGRLWQSVWPLRFWYWLTNSHYCYLFLKLTHHFVVGWQCFVVVALKCDLPFCCCVRLTNSHYWYLFLNLTHHFVVGWQCFVVVALKCDLPFCCCVRLTVIDLLPVMEEPQRAPHVSPCQTTTDSLFSLIFLLDSIPWWALLHVFFFPVSLDSQSYRMISI